MPLDMPPPRDSRFGWPLTLSRVHWVRPELVAEGKFLSWTEDNLLREELRYLTLAELEAPFRTLQIELGRAIPGSPEHSIVLASLENVGRDGGTPYPAAETVSAGASV